MNHDECRESLALDEREEQVLAHLEQCPRCRAFSDGLDRLDAVAPLLAPAPPSGIADRVLTRLHEPAPQRPGNVVPLRSWRGPVGDAVRMTSVRLTAAAAALVLVAAGVTVVLANREDASEVVLASAHATAASGSADVQVEATTEVALDAPGEVRPGRVPAAPDFREAPPEMQRYMRREWERAMRQFERSMEEFFQQVDRAVEEGTSQLDDAMRQMEEDFARAMQDMGAGGSRESEGSPTRPRGAAPPPPPAPRQPADPADPAVPPAPPTGVTARVGVRGTGTVDFSSDALALEGVVAPGVGATAGTESFRIATRGEVQAYRSRRGGWRQVPGPAGPLGTVLLDPQAAIRIAESASGRVHALGQVRLAGEDLAHYRFEVDPAMLGANVAGHATAEAYVGADGRLRRIELLTANTGAAGGARTRSRVAVSYSGYGDARPPVVPADVPRMQPLPERSSLLLYPLGRSVEGALARGER